MRVWVWVWLGVRRLGLDEWHRFGVAYQSITVDVAAVLGALLRTGTAGGRSRTAAAVGHYGRGARTGVRLLRLLLLLLGAIRAVLSYCKSRMAHGLVVKYRLGMGAWVHVASMLGIRDTYDGYVMNIWIQH